MLLEIVKNSANERVRVAAALGYSRCLYRSHIEPSQEVLLTLYEISKYGKRPACKEEAASVLRPLIYRFDPTGDLWESKMKPQLEALEAKYKLAAK